MKHCPVCDKDLPEDAFNKNASAYDGLQSNCRVCAAAVRAAKHAKIRSAPLTCTRCGQTKEADQFPKRRSDPLRCNDCRAKAKAEYAVEYQKAHREELRKYARAYNRAHPVKRTKEYNDERARKARERWRNDPEHRTRIIEKQRANKAKRPIAPKSTVEIIGDGVPAAVRVTGHLLQHSLETALHAVVGPENWLGREITVPNTRMRWDMGFKRKDGQVVIVEYDGDTHYCDPFKIKTDAVKDAAAGALGYAVVRMPFWVQLTTVTLKHFFGLDAIVETEFPHGFITTRFFPSRFCGLGIARFRRELDALPEQVRADVITSLRERSKEHGVDCILPPSLVSLVVGPRLED